MPLFSLDEIRSVVQTWQLQKRQVFKRSAYNGGTNARSLREFVEVQNRLGRRLISGMENQDPDFWVSLAELANHCATITANAKTFVNGQDVTQEGM